MKKYQTKLEIDFKIGSNSEVNNAYTKPNVNIINIQKIGSDQFFTLRPSRGPNGIILKAANIELPHNQAITN